MLQLSPWGRIMELCCLAPGKCSRGAVLTMAALGMEVSTTSQRRYVLRR